MINLRHVLVGWAQHWAERVPRLAVVVVVVDAEGEWVGVGTTAPPDHTERILRSALAGANRQPGPAWIACGRCGADVTWVRSCVCGEEDCRIPRTSPPPTK